MKTNKKYNYEIPNIIIRPFIFVYFTLIIAWYDSGKESLNLSDIPTWILRYLGVYTLRHDYLNYYRTRKTPSTFYMLVKSNLEWQKRKKEILNRKTITYRIIKG